MKPSIAELLNASGHTLYTPELVQRAMYTLYGNIGANLDERNWTAILQTQDPLANAESALRSMYQDKGYLLRNTQHLENTGYVAAQAEFTYRQMADRLGYTYQNDWSSGTNYAYLGPLTLDQLRALVPSSPSEPPPSIDSSAPTASATTATISASGNAVVQSSETGTAYLVKNSITVSNLASITSAADDQVNAVTISSANTPTNLAATGLVDGSYQVYAVDAVGNLSAAASNLVTIDSAVPTLQSSAPADNATAVAVDANITLNFNEAIKAGSGNFLIKKTSDDTTVATIAISDATQVSITGSTVTLNPTGNLTAGTGYYVELASGVLTDLAGNAYAGTSDKTTLNFTTSSIPSNVLFTVTSTQGAANGLTFGFLDVNGNGTVDTNYTGDATDDFVSWTDFNTLDLAASAWRMATLQELLDLVDDPAIANPPAGWSGGYYYWSSDSAGAGAHWSVYLSYGGPYNRHRPRRELRCCGVGWVGLPGVWPIKGRRMPHRATGFVL